MFPVHERLPLAPFPVRVPSLCRMLPNRLERSRRGGSSGVEI